MPNKSQEQKISAFVISYNSENTIVAVMKGLSFADEVILVDKSSLDTTVERAAPFVDKIYIVPWTPTVEATRAFAEAQCQHDMIVFLDADECLNIKAAHYFNRELRNPSHDIYSVPRKEYIIGRHDSDAYYWPEHHIRAYKRGALAFGSKVHAGISEMSDNLFQISIEDGIAIEHLSHANVYQWIEKLNRYTSQSNRHLMHDSDTDLVASAHRSIDQWVSKSKNAKAGSYPAAVAVLRATYDLIDHLKTWESANEPDGEGNFRAFASRLEDEYAAAGLGAPRGGPEYISTRDLNAQDLKVLAQRALAALAIAVVDKANALASIDAREEHLHSEIAKLNTENKNIILEKQNLHTENQNLNKANKNLVDVTQNQRNQICDLANELAAIKSSKFWKKTTPLRSLIERHPDFARKLNYGAKIILWTLSFQLSKRLKREALRKTKVQELAVARSVAVPLDARESFALASSLEPRVTIIVPTYGQNDYTHKCLYSLFSFPPKTPFEVIVVDDAFPGEGAAALADSIQGAKFIVNKDNLGFLRTCNSAAAQARGAYLFFLNNDAEVTSGAIDALVDLLDADSTVGMTGSKLLYPDGTLQEAGGIVWADASAWNWGRNSDPHRPEYSYRRDVDYISGAAIMLAKRTFDDLHGFDEAFAPAYYEDTDLAFRIRSKGLRVVFEPRSVIIHHEGKSHGVDVAAGTKAYQLRNAVLMRSRWNDVLLSDHYENGTSVLRARDRAKNRKVILVADHYTPEPDRDAGSRSTMGILQCLVRAGWVVKFWPENRAYSKVYTPALEALGIEVLDGRTPATFADWVLENGGALDFVLLMRPETSTNLLPVVKSLTAAKRCYYGHDVHFARMLLEANLTQDPVLIQKTEEMQAIERGLWKQFDSVIYLSNEEAKLVREIDSGVNARSIIGFCQQKFVEREQAPSGNMLLFVAGFGHPPNVDAAKFLLRDIFPLIKAACPEARLVLAGSNPTDEIKALASNDVTVTGWISAEKLEAFYGEARAAVVPLRIGAGVKGKVVEALAEGVPLVTTSIGAQGIEGLEAIALVRDEAEQIAEALIKLLKDDAAWLAQSKSQTAFARESFSIDKMQASVIAAIESAAGDA